MKRGQSACGKHWHSLPLELQQAITTAQRKGASALGAARLDARDYLASKMIGPHDFKECRGANCKAEIVWLPGPRNMRIPVAAASVRASDEYFDSNRHEDHRQTCPAMPEFRK